MNKFGIVLIILIFIIISASYVLADEILLEIVIDGWPIYSDEPPIISSSNRVLVPIRVLTENLGYEVEWDEQNKTVSILKDDLVISFKIGIQKMWINGVEKVIDVKPIVKNGRTYLPVRVVSEAIGCEVSWDGQSKSVIVITGKKAVEISTNETDESTVLYDENYSFISTKNNLTNYEIFELDNPLRLVIDFNQILLEDLIIPQLSQDGIVKEIRYSQYELNPNKVRVVIDLNSKADYNVIINDNSFVLSLKPHIYKVVLDAGHGGKDPGAIGVSGTYEKTLNFDITLKLVELLKDYPDIQIYLTRDSDTYLSLNDRISYANNIGADIYLSIHHNSIPYKSSVNGSETYYGREYSLDFANIVHKHLLAATGLKNHGMEKADFRVIRYTRMPAVLIEVGYLSNREEEQLMLDPKFQDNVASGLKDAIKEYLKIE